MNVFTDLLGLSIRFTDSRARGPGFDTYFRFSFRRIKKGSCQFLAKVCARILSRKRVIKLTNRPDMTVAVHRGRKTTQQQQQQLLHFIDSVEVLNLALTFDSVVKLGLTSLT